MSEQNLFMQQHDAKPVLGVAIYEDPVAGTSYVRLCVLQQLSWFGLVLVWFVFIRPLLSVHLLFDSCAVAGSSPVPRQSATDLT